MPKKESLKEVHHTPKSGILNSMGFFKGCFDILTRQNITCIDDDLLSYLNNLIEDSDNPSQQEKAVKLIVMLVEQYKPQRGSSEDSLHLLDTLKNAKYSHHLKLLRIRFYLSYVDPSSGENNYGKRMYNAIRNALQGLKEEDARRELLHNNLDALDIPTVLLPIFKDYL